MEDDAHFEIWFDQEYRRVLSAVLVVCAGDVIRAEDGVGQTPVSVAAAYRLKAAPNTSNCSPKWLWPALRAGDAKGNRATPQFLITATISSTTKSL